MNPEIKRLLLQVAPRAGEDGEYLPSLHTPVDIEKFAEMIVRECIVQIQLTTARDPQYTAQYKQSVGHIHRIRQHFGIE